MSQTTISLGQMPDLAGDVITPRLQRALDLRNQGKQKEALAICRRVLRRSPDHLMTLVLLGICLHEAGGNEDESIASFQKALRINLHVPLAHAYLAQIYRKADRTEEARQHANALYHLDSNNSDYLTNIALVMEEAGDRDNAYRALYRAIGRKKGHADAHLALAQLLLADGEWDAGWDEYEWRDLTVAGLNGRPKSVKIQSAPWTGFRLKAEDGPVFIMGDQGFGDTIQFARYLPLVAERCAKVVIGCSPEIRSVISRIPGVSLCTHLWTEVPLHAAHRSMSSLPLIFRARPHEVPPAPYLTADPGKVAEWQDRLPRGPLIGIKWAGRESHPNNARRSVTLETLLPLANVPDVTLVSLQVPADPVDTARIAQFPNILNPSADLKDWEDTAALVANLDLVISVDTGVAHLAGAMDVPCWTLLPFVGEWRWGTNQTTTPWYGSMTLYRQRIRGDWKEVIWRVRDDLAVFARPRLDMVA